jgi:hypothetical protein
VRAEQGVTRLRKPEGVAQSGEVSPTSVAACAEDVEGGETPWKGRSPTSFSSLASMMSAPGTRGFRVVPEPDRRPLWKAEVWPRIADEPARASTRARGWQKRSSERRRRPTARRGARSGPQLNASDERRAPRSADVARSREPGTGEDGRPKRRPPTRASARRGDPTFAERSRRLEAIASCSTISAPRGAKEEPARTRGHGPLGLEPSSTVRRTSSCHALRSGVGGLRVRLTAWQGSEAGRHGRLKGSLEPGGQPAAPLTSS